MESVQQMSDARNEKKAIRSRVLAARDALPAAAREQYAESVLATALASTQFVHAKAVLAYVSFGSELSTETLLRRTLAEGKSLVLPRVVKGAAQLQLHRVQTLDQLTAGVWGIREPRADAPTVALYDIDFILVPGVAFDLAGFRIGYGGGYYDRLLGAANPATTRLSVAFDCQLVDAVPNEAHDARVDIIITNQQTYLIEHDRKNH
jgi:5-formyltetrahydrofolate cyclo-ligase